MRKLTNIFVAIICSTMLADTLRAEQIDNPAYQAWAKFKPGTSVTYKTSIDMKMPAGAPAMPPGAMDSTITQTLKEVRDDAVVVEVKIAGGMMAMAGRGGSGTTNIIPAKVDKDQEGLPPNLKGEVKDVKTGEDKVDVNGKTYDAKTREMTIITTSPQAMESHMKIWSAATVPGGMVKSEMTTTTPAEVHTTTTLQSFTEGK
jgi:hypothetical protein